MATVTNATLIFGDSGSGKSSLLATLGEWGWNKHKKVSLLYSTDGGGFPSQMDAFIRAGIVRVWKLRTRGEAFETCSRACQGYWPVEFTDPIAGETPPGVQLVPSIVTTYSLHCSKCDALVFSSQDRKTFGQVHSCPECGARVNLQTGYVKEASKVSEFFKDVGLVMFDGLTSMNDWIMTDMSNMTAHGTLKGEGTALGGVIRQGDMAFSGSNRSHYGFAQIRSAQWLQDATNIQGLTIGPIFTARKQRATDSNTNIRVYGPAIAGQAKTSDVPAWVGNCLGATTRIDEKGRKEWRLYLTEYREDNDEILHLCKTRAAPGILPDYLSDGPLDPATNKPLSGKESFEHFNLGHFMDLMESATTKTLEATLGKYPDAPGIKTFEKPKPARPKAKIPPTGAKPPTITKTAMPPKATSTMAKPPGRRLPPRPGRK